jgi:hypothetical protein
MPTETEEVIKPNTAVPAKPKPLGSFTKKEIRRLDNLSDGRMKSSQGKYELESDYLDDYADRIRKEDRMQHFEQEFYGELNKQLDEYARQVMHLKTDVPGICVVQRGPVIPISPNLSKLVSVREGGKKEDQSKAKSYSGLKITQYAGIKVAHVAGYYIFEDQILLGVKITELAKQDAVVSTYRSTCKMYLDKIHELQNKLLPLELLRKRLKEIYEEVDELLNAKEDPNRDQRVDANEARTQRKDFLIEEGSKLTAKIKEEEDANVGPLVELNNVHVEYDNYKTMEKLKLSTQLEKSISGHKSLSEAILEKAIAGVSQLNEKLEGDDSLVFVTSFGFDPTATLGKVQAKSIVVNPILHGNLAYFWLMKIRTVNIIKRFLGSDVHITGYSFPKKERSKIMKRVDNEVKVTGGFTDEILKLRKFGTLRDNAFKKMQVFLIKQHKEMDAYFTELFDKIWAESEEVLKEMKNKGGSK